MGTHPLIDGGAEWLEADGLGGFASGTVSGIRTRRYHALLLVSLRPPTDRVVLVNGLDAWIETADGRIPITAHRYAPDIVYPASTARLAAFSAEPWPQWIYRLRDGAEIIQQVVVPRGQPLVTVSWRLRAPLSALGSPAVLCVRPLLSGRDAHSLHQENTDFRFDAEEDDERVRWHPYFGLPGVVAVSNGAYTHDPVWYRRFLYSEERSLGLDDTEDLASPGVLRWDLSRGEAVLVLTTDIHDGPPEGQGAAAWVHALRAAEQERRLRHPTRLHRAAEAYRVQRNGGRTILAGYPWSTDWGRDTFVALRGLCLATGQLDEAREILLAWTAHVSAGMLPNYFAERRREPEFNSVDSSLWFVVAVHEYLRAAGAAGTPVPRADEAALRGAVGAILAGYASGTRYGIRLDADGLLAAGEPGTALTWMDSQIGEWIVTPRIGKPVEVQALWLNALRIGAACAPRWLPVFQRGLASFRRRFWHEHGFLHDVVDVDHRPGTVDSSFRPNQIFAVGGLPYALLHGEQARQVVDAVEARLWTPLGLRTLAPGEPGYAGRYEGGPRQRAAVYHQGTVWPWLLGPFVEAWVRVRGNTAEARREARRRFLAPLIEHLDEAGLGHVSELADGDPPHTPRGSPFQARALGELLRLALDILAEAPLDAPPPAADAADPEAVTA